MTTTTYGTGCQICGAPIRCDCFSADNVNRLIEENKAHKKHKAEFIEWLKTLILTDNYSLIDSAILQNKIINAVKDKAEEML